MMFQMLFLLTRVFQILFPLLLFIIYMGWSSRLLIIIYYSSFLHLYK